jgi:hypothetical protein
MKQLLYVMQFTGHGAAVAGSSNQLRARTSSGSCQISTRIGTGGLEFSIQNISGGQASFESEVTVTGENSFVESGHIRFGDHGLRFSTVGQGYLAASPDPNLRHGTVTWRVDSGEGQFEGARGLITSNFTIGQDGQVVDNHFGLLFVK